MTATDWNPPTDGVTQWNTAQLREQFEVLSFQAPFVVVRRKADNALGSLQFDHAPRRYYGFVAD